MSGGVFYLGNPSVDVNIQDQHTPPLASYFLKSVSTFTISEDTGSGPLFTLLHKRIAGLSMGEAEILLKK